jgi:flavin-dependent dehydrogenase
VRSLDLVAHLERRYQRFYINVDREAFDRWLVSLVPSRIETGYGWRLTALDRDDEGSFLRFTTAEGGDAGVRARLVVGADGAASLVRRLAYADNPAPERYSAIQAEYETSSPDASYGAIFDATLTDFYGWTIPKGDSLLIGGAFPAGPGVSAKFDTMVNRLRSSGMRFGTRLALSSAMISRPTSLLHLCPGATGVHLVGEAAGFISPSSAEGISYALKSASALASALQPGLAGAEARYRAAAWPLAVNVGMKALKASAIYGQTTRRMIMRSGLGAIADHPQVGGVPQTRLAR